MTDSTLETEYTTEPVKITQRVSVAPTMAGGIAIRIDGEHIDHFRQDALEELAITVEAALDTNDAEGHTSPSERKFKRYLEESMRLQTELAWHLHILYSKMESGEQNAHAYKSMMDLIGSIEHKIDMMDFIAAEMEKEDLQ